MLSSVASLQDVTCNLRVYLKDTVQIISIEPLKVISSWNIGKIKEGIVHFCQVWTSLYVRKDAGEILINYTEMDS